MRIAIIPARAGSRRIPGKNKRLFYGLPIYAYSLLAAVSSRLFDRIVITTDDHDIAANAATYGAEVLWRPPEMARDEVGTQEVTGWALGKLEHTATEPFTEACCIYPTAPLLMPSDLQEAYWELRNRGTLYAMSVGSEPLRDAGCFYWGKTFAFRGAHPLIGPWTTMIALPEDRVCDINTEQDWQRALGLYAKHNLGARDAEIQTSQ